MSKYIDAERLRAEIEKRLKNVRDYMNGGGMKYKGPRYYKMQGKESAYDALLNIIDSLQQEQPEVDIATEYDEQFNSDPVYGKLANRIVGKAIARHFYELGRRADK